LIKLENITASRHVSGIDNRPKALKSRALGANPKSVPANIAPLFEVVSICNATVEGWRFW
jgi:hypothetical protein